MGTRLLVLYLPFALKVEAWLIAKGFIGQYLLWLLYPSGLRRDVQIILGAIVVGINFGICGYEIFLRKRWVVDSK
jgi:hypothetical protein